MYSAKIAHDLYVFLCLRMDEFDDAFAVEGAWNRNNEFPTNPPIDDGLLAQRALSAEATCGCMLPDRTWTLAEHYGGTEFESDVLSENWDKVIDQLEQDPLGSLSEALEKVDDAVGDAMRHIRQSLFPYFRSVAQLFGYEWTGLRQ